ncbi:MAG: DNA cytosine methyltransferase [Alphaproteobacteria bacterium]
MSNRLKAIDLFAGCGGLSLGLRRAGFSIIAAFDSDRLAASTYKMNHRRTKLYEGDIRDVSPDRVREELGIERGELDLLAGCPPCQGFSTLRTLNGSKSINEPLNDLIFDFLAFVEAFEPKSIMMENVPALYADDRLVRFRKRLDELSYKHTAKVLDAWDYGVPQRRKRMILMAGQETLPSFARPVSRKQTVSGHLRRNGRDISADPAHSYSVKRSDEVQNLIKKIPANGGSRTDLPNVDQLECHKRCDGFKDIYGRMAWEKPSPTITGGCINPSKGRFLHPEEHRAITLREAAILQGFPTSYQFDLSRGRYPAAQMIGNAFPPKFAEHHAKQLYDQISNLGAR